MKTDRLLFVFSVALLVACAHKETPDQSVTSAVTPTTTAVAPAAAAAPTAATPRAERGTPAEAQAMLKSAAEHYKAVGRTQALADFNAKKPPFGDRDLYVACIGNNHVLTANGGFPQYVGSSPDMLRDANGKSVSKALLDAAASSPTGGSVRYRWINPVTGKNEAKVSFAQRFGEDVCLVGAYSPD